jgi:hypothetical protein
LGLYGRNLFVVSCSLLRHEIFSGGMIAPRTGQSINAGDHCDVPMEGARL